MSTSISVGRCGVAVNRRGRSRHWRDTRFHRSCDEGLEDTDGNEAEESKSSIKIINLIANSSIQWVFQERSHDFANNISKQVAGVLLDSGFALDDRA